MRSGVYRAERAVLRRLDSDRVGNLCASQGSCREVRGSAVDGLAVHEGVAIGRGHRMHVVRIHKIEVANVVLKTFLLRMKVFRSLILSKNS